MSLYYMPSFVYPFLSRYPSDSHTYANSIVSGVNLRNSAPSTFTEEGLAADCITLKRREDNDFPNSIITQVPFKALRNLLYKF